MPSFLSTASGLIARKVRSMGLSFSSPAADLSALALSGDLRPVDLAPPPVADFPSTDLLDDLCSHPPDRFSLLQHRFSDLQGQRVKGSKDQRVKGSQGQNETHKSYK